MTRPRSCTSGRATTTSRSSTRRAPAPRRARCTSSATATGPCRRPPCAPRPTRSASPTPSAWRRRSGGCRRAWRSTRSRARTSRSGRRSRRRSHGPSTRSRRGGSSSCRRRHVPDYGCPAPAAVREHRHARRPFPAVGSRPPHRCRAADAAPAGGRARTGAPAVPRRTRDRMPQLSARLPDRDRAAQAHVSDGTRDHRQPVREGAIGQHGRDRQAAVDAERQERADHAPFHAAEPAGERQHVGDHAGEVGHHHDAARRRSAEGPEARREHGDVERPPAERSQQRRIAVAQQDEGAADARAHGGSTREHGDQERARDHEPAEQRRDDGEPERRRAGQQPCPQPRARQHERRHEDRVEHRVERGEPARQRAAAHAAAAQRPGRERDPSCAREREQAGRGHAGEGDVVALAPPDPPAARREEPVEREHVRGIRGDLEQGGRTEPERVAGREPAPGVIQPRDLRKADIDARHGGHDQQDRPRGRASHRRVRRKHEPVLSGATPAHIPAIPRTAAESYGSREARWRRRSPNA